MPRILIVDELAATAVEILTAARFEVDVRTGLSPEGLAAIIGDYDGVLLRRPSVVTGEIIEAGTRLQLIGRAGIALDNVDVAAATRRGIAVVNTPFGNATTVAEHAIGLMFALARDLPRAVASVAGGGWERTPGRGQQLAGKTLGVIGLGTVGRLVAKRGQGLEMKVIGYDPWVSESDVQKDVGIEIVSFAQLFARSDFISLHVPHTEQTHHFIGDAAFVAMKRSAYLINCARGGVVDEAALEKALDLNELAGAALDVYEQMPPPADHPLRAHPKVISTPHLSAQTAEAMEAVSRQIAENARDFFLHGIVASAVNAPAMDAARRKRIAPQLELVARAARIAAQLHTGAVKQVSVLVAGDFDPDDVAPIVAHGHAVALSELLGQDVNDIAAPAIASEEGIRVVSAARDGDTDFTNLIRVELSGLGMPTRVDGAVFGRRELRIVSIDNHRVDLVPKGHILSIRNENVPGVVGAVGTALGEHGINVSRLGLGLRSRDGEALALWSTDEAVSDAALEAIGAVEGVIATRRLELD